MSEFIARPDGQWVDVPRLYHSQEWGIERTAGRADGAANTFAGSLFHKNNATIVYVRKIAPNGQVLQKWNLVFEGAPHDTNYNNPQWTGPGKIDDFYMYPSGSDLIVSLVGHDTNTARLNPWGWKALEGVYTPHTGTQPEDGAAGAYRGGNVDPEPNPNPNPEPEYRLGADEFKDAFLGAAANREFYTRFQKMVENGVEQSDIDGMLHGLEDRLFARLVGDPGPLADLLYGRIKDGVFLELRKWQEGRGFKPDPTPVPEPDGQEDEQA